MYRDVLDVLFLIERISYFGRIYNSAKTGIMGVSV